MKLTKINIKCDECNVFPGKWSLKPAQVFSALRSVRYDNVLKIIEFGSGAGTTALATLLADKNIPLKYIAYENDSTYSSAHPAVKTVLWAEFPTKLVNGVFDLVIIDGPHGVVRAKWYPMLRKHVRIGTVMLIDDFLHFPEFNAALTANFEYTVLDEYVEERNPNRGGWVTWKVVQVTTIKE